jgi:mannose-6-phosphate isomerase-like protein (cupin superfamily)
MDIKMSRHPYLIDLNDPNDWLYPIQLKNPDGGVGEDQRTIFMPEGEGRLFCVTDSVMHASPDRDHLMFHEHTVGWEVFFVDSGGMDIYMNGKMAYIEPGSILFIQPYEAHGMFFRADVKYRGFFHHLSNSDNSSTLGMLRARDPDFMDDPEFPKELFAHGDFGLREPPVDFVEVSPERHPNIRHRSRPMAAYELDGVTMKMITARWENGGSLELWCAEMKKGFWAQWDPYPTAREMYYITSGEVKFKVMDEEFVAKAENIVNIPRCAAHSLEALTDAVVYDVGGLPRWYAFFQDRASVKKLDPERWAKPETVEELKKKFGIQIKAYGVK